MLVAILKAADWKNARFAACLLPLSVVQIAFEAPCPRLTYLFITGYNHGKQAIVGDCATIIFGLNSN